MAENKKIVKLNGLYSPTDSIRGFIPQIEREIKFPYDSPIPAFNTLASALDLLKDLPKLEVLLENLSEKEREFLYSHPIVQEFDLLP